VPANNHHTLLSYAYTRHIWMSDSSFIWHLKRQSEAIWTEYVIECEFWWLHRTHLAVGGLTLWRHLD
jgi:hypothetical protein